MKLSRSRRARSVTVSVEAGGARRRAISVGDGFRVTVRGDRGRTGALAVLVAGANRHQGGVEAWQSR